MIKQRKLKDVTTEEIKNNTLKELNLEIINGLELFSTKFYSKNEKVFCSFCNKELKRLIKKINPLDDVEYPLIERVQPYICICEKAIEDFNSKALLQYKADLIDKKQDKELEFKHQQYIEHIKRINRFD